MRRSAFFIRVIILGFILHLYIGLRLIPDLPVSTPYRWLAALLLLLSWLFILLAIAARRLESARLSDRLAWVGLPAMGAFSSLLVLTLLRDISLLALLVLNTAASEWRADSAVAVPLFALLLTFAGFINARRLARVVTIKVPIENLPAALQGFTIVQISDIHVGPTIKRRYVDAIVDAVNLLEADMIALTGDLVDGTVERLAGHTLPFSRLRARHGAYAVTGNHEYLSGVHGWITEFERLGMKILQNEHVVIAHGDARLVVAGVNDFSAGRFDPAQRSDPAAAIAGAPPEAAIRLLLAHQPRSAAAASEAGFTLQLSGHTHGGQFFPWNFFVRLQQPFTAGLNRYNNLWVYTSRGTGYWGPPKRIAAPSEITRLLLVAAG
ncbi:metallophosphoesterase [Candidatus Methylospira mobilis]|uniref:Metallophosphoesterase n=1 Tax=Candidatus Methylospira mobilis TaxID=1808979 RepID=A0A5Q0BKN6_9GAMM|nr:metallophosphoesterase [Candidatus Methylospira mobilis]QFY44403.1 metallophosphoesterase [Candidatus Methylospira mobilis]WNV06160.1 metallophosphoesterase [Candidatus Methylospira mobilis]